MIKSIDISGNALTVEFGALVELKNLNLSRNCLSGHIPETIGRISSLESLDLSWNQLSGVIPQSMASLHLLSHLNMSYNNLSEGIPLGSQLQTLGDEDSHIFAGNSYLCSPLVPEHCSETRKIRLITTNTQMAMMCCYMYFQVSGFGLGFSAVW
ncbi:hypothetical protein ACP70R_041903 [Stipagrostis hirtigluma subsp. patula]